MTDIGAPAYSLRNNIKRITVLGAPLLAGRLSHYSHQVADSIMLGHFGEGSLELAALAVAGMFFWVLNTFLWPLSNGIQAIVSRRLGSGGETAGPSNLGQIMDQGIITALIFSLVAFTLSFFTGPLFRLILHEERIIELSLDYIRILRWSFIPQGVQIIIMRFFSSIHKPRYSMITSLVSNGVNIILNYIFIYGKFGLPEMGIKGAALGSLLSMWIALLYILSVTLRKEYIRKYRFFHSRKPDWRIIKNIIRIAMPPAIQNILAMLIMLFYEAMVENIGAVYLASTHIVLSFYRINKTIVGGFSHGAAILIGNELGAENKRAAKAVMHAGYLIGAAIGLIIFILVFCFPGTVASIFAAPGETLDTATIALRFFAIFFFFEILGFTFEMVFTGNAWGKFVLFSEFTTNILFILTFTFITTRLLGMGVNMAWLGFGLYQVFHSLLLHIGYKSGHWMHAKVD
ncbi:MAG: MATE family efflux transporter [Spirochaetales bacterium]|uniref:Multidrug-efflux transporter n=1 Tax=Candidatus Thalassospirochaeta sargassi TaxID=3119039 RepID=A0AAJ1MIX7_9SPIO|nr:MATE family efflux transporter [Spirochaetales bacterium]